LNAFGERAHQTHFTWKEYKKMAKNTAVQCKPPWKQSTLTKFQEDSGPTGSPK